MSLKTPSISVIISTYNNVPWLQKCLWSYAQQSITDFEIIIADDGSGPETKALIEKISADFPLPISHIWHKDNGFQKSAILNKAILESKADYILMSDGDCIVKANFVEKHLKFRKPDCFLSGGYFKLPLNISELITKEDIESQRCFNKSWLRSKGLKRTLKTQKLTARGLIAKILNSVTPTKASWNGHNASGWKKDILAVNGFDERMQYGGEDRELGERLINSGIKSIQARYSLVCVHLYHERPYKNEESLKLNKAIRKETKLNKHIKTQFGIKKAITY